MSTSTHWVRVDLLIKGDDYQSALADAQRRLNDWFIDCRWHDAPYPNGTLLYYSTWPKEDLDRIPRSAVRNGERIGAH